MLWGLLWDLLCFPVFLLLFLCGRAPAALPLRPLQRVAEFAVEARITAALIGLNLLTFALQCALAPTLSPARFLRLFALSPRDLEHGNWPPLLLHLFAHAGPGHLLGNMMTLFVFGRIVERHLGGAWTLGVYLGAATVSTTLSMAAQVALAQNIPTLGASGAIAGLLALGVLLDPFTITFEALVPMPVMVLGWVALGTDLSGVLSSGAARSSVDHFAHMGGYLSVLILYPFLGEQDRRRTRLGLGANLATVVLMILLWAALKSP